MFSVISVRMMIYRVFRYVTQQSTPHEHNLLSIKKKSVMKYVWKGNDQYIVKVISVALYVERDKTGAGE